MAWHLQLRKKNLKMCPELVDHYNQVQEELERQLLLARQTDEDFAQPEKQLPAVVDQQVPQTSGLFKLIKGYKEKRKQLRKATLIANSRWFIKECVIPPQNHRGYL